MIVGGKSQFVTSSSGISRMFLLALEAIFEAEAAPGVGVVAVGDGAAVRGPNLRLSRLFAFI